MRSRRFASGNEGRGMNERQQYAYEHPRTSAQGILEREQMWFLNGGWKVGLSLNA
jgi:hypothetical protein